ncbi:MAG: prepilin-type N-terminal cleavage/methylation domain-containing protein [Desulfobacterales bacterium]|nr:MAG: prepilin-type N-terminal cleavage/methylation domain-containing protein [Desulfobacterales bacterium]
MHRRQQNNVVYCNDCQGYSLIEVLIAMAVFSIGILAVFSMQITATNSNTMARGMTESYNCALDKAEELLALPFNDADLTAGVHNLAKNADGIDNDGDGLVDGDDADGEAAGYIDLQWEVWDTRVHDQNIKSVRVSVTSMVKRGRQKILNIDFIKADM